MFFFILFQSNKCWRKKVLYHQSLVWSTFTGSFRFERLFSAIIWLVFLQPLLGKYPPVWLVINFLNCQHDSQRFSHSRIDQLMLVKDSNFQIPDIQHSMNINFEQKRSDLWKSHSVFSLSLALFHSWAKLASYFCQVGVSVQALVENKPPPKTVGNWPTENGLF